MQSIGRLVVFQGSSTGRVAPAACGRTNHVLFLTAHSSRFAGTGKSHLIAHALLPQIIQRGGRALVLCNSNAALDSIAEKVLDPGEFISNGGYVSAESRCEFSEKGLVSVAARTLKTPQALISDKPRHCLAAHPPARPPATFLVTAAVSYGLPYVVQPRSI